MPVAAMLWMVYGPIPQLTIPDDACEPNDRRTADGQYLELAEELLDRMGEGPRENYWVRLATPELTEDRKPSPTPYHALPESLLDEPQTQLTFPARLTGADRQRLQQYLTDNEAWFESVLAPPPPPLSVAVKREPSHGILTLEDLDCPSMWACYIIVRRLAERAFAQANCGRTDDAFQSIQTMQTITDRLRSVPLPEHHFITTRMDWETLSAVWHFLGVTKDVSPVQESWIRELVSEDQLLADLARSRRGRYRLAVDYVCYLHRSRLRDCVEESAPSWGNRRLLSNHVTRRIDWDKVLLSCRTAIIDHPFDLSQSWLVLRAQCVEIDLAHGLHSNMPLDFELDASVLWSNGDLTDRLSADTVLHCSSLMPVLGMYKELAIKGDAIRVALALRHYHRERQSLPASGAELQRVCPLAAKRVYDYSIDDHWLHVYFNGPDHSPDTRETRWPDDFVYRWNLDTAAWYGPPEADSPAAIPRTKKGTVETVPDALERI